MRCPTLEQWTAFYGGELDERATGRLAAHLEECPACQTEFDRLCRLGAALRDGLAAPTRPAASRPRRVRSVERSWIPLAAAAAFTAVAVSLLWSAKESRPPGVASAASRPVEPLPPAIPAAPPVDPVPPPRPATVPPALPRTPAPEGSAPAEPAPAIPPPVEAPPAPPPAPTATEREEVAASARTTAGTAPPPAETAPTLGVLERVEGQVLLTSATDGWAARAALPLAFGRGLATVGPRSRAVVRFADGTRMELGERTVVRKMGDLGGEGGAGKRVDLAEGTLTLEVTHQAAGRAMVIETPHAEARIVGTVLRLSAEPGEKGSTRLEVLEGKVRLSRPGAAVDVSGGFGATAGPAVELAARPLPRSGAEPVFRYTFEDGRLPKGIEAGAVERGPERAGSRFCVAGTQPPGATAGAHVKLTDDGRGLFSYSEDLFLAFDYWAGDSVRTLDLQVWSRAQQTTLGTTVGTPLREQWIHLVVPLSELARPEPDRVLHLRPGEAVPTLWIQAGQVGGTLYLDNLELLRLSRRDGRR